MTTSPMTVPLRFARPVVVFELNTSCWRMTGELSRYHTSLGSNAGRQRRRCIKFEKHALRSATSSVTRLVLPM